MNYTRHQFPADWTIADQLSNIATVNLPEAMSLAGGVLAWLNITQAVMIPPELHAQWVTEIAAQMTKRAAEFYASDDYAQLQVALKEAGL